MYATETTTDRARWEVMWYAKGRWFRKDFQADFASALTFYTKVAQSDRKGVTLRCKNMGFPPPDQYADHEEVVSKVVKGGKMYRRKTQVMIEPRRYQVKMREVNVRGIWWCPFCVSFRKFVKGTRFGDTTMSCPACGVAHTHGSILKYNPIAARGAGRKTRSDKGTIRA